MKITMFQQIGSSQTGPVYKKLENEVNRHLEKINWQDTEISVTSAASNGVFVFTVTVIEWGANESLA